MLEASFMAFRMLPEKVESMKQPCFPGLGRGLGRGTSTGLSSLTENNCPYPPGPAQRWPHGNKALSRGLVNWFQCYQEGCCANQLSHWPT